MYSENYFVPKILLRGDKAEFLARIGECPYKLVGEINFVGEAEGQQFHLLRDGKFSIDGKLHGYQELITIIRGGVDYLVFNDSQELKKIGGILQSIGCARSQIITLREFQYIQKNYFYDSYSDIQLMDALKALNYKTLLDVDAHFTKSYMFTKGLNDFTEIDCICKTELKPIQENIYAYVYKDISDCQFRHYDAALIYGRNNLDFMTTFSALEGMTDVVITFAQYESEFEKYLAANVNFFESVNFIPSFAGRWLICKRHTPPKDFTMYVVTHKALPPEHVEKLPAGYKIIHAGRKLTEDLGYLGDNTGDNISHLNPYINELTALYWMWKNTNNTIIGLSHYRRFFTASVEEKNFLSFVDSRFEYEKILTEQQAENLLNRYDILVTKPAYRHAPWIEESGLAGFDFTIIRKHLARVHADYVDAFDYLTTVPHFYCKSMFVARRNVFDAYCEWLFSFYIDATQEVLSSKLYTNTGRTMGFLAERLITVWLIKNRLRIKELYIIERPDL